MSETFETAVENAARLLRNRENGLVRTYGSSGSEAVSIAAGWSDLARTLALRVSDSSMPDREPT